MDGANSEIGTIVRDPSPTYVVYDPVVWVRSTEDEAQYNPAWCPQWSLTAWNGSVESSNRSTVLKYK